MRSRYTIRRYLRLGALLLSSALLVAGVLASPALAKKPSSPGGGNNGGGSSGGGHNGGGGTSTTGYDISWPQCGSSYPTGQAFGIVGVNDGLANNLNPCLNRELAWAAGSSGATSQPAASLYINTGNPGPTYQGTPIADWPGTNNTGKTDPYGSCTSKVWSTACAWVYGWDMGNYSYGQAATAEVGTRVDVTTAPWWLDIETGNSWATSSATGYTDLNLAAIVGYFDGLKDSGASGPIGIYSTSSQWNTITGLGSSTTTGYFTSYLSASSLPISSWVPGARSLKQAKSNCAATSSFTGPNPLLAQYSSGGFDADLLCSLA